jgi:pimeloyl-ACP methyl ester carboxylesterase
MVGLVADFLDGLDLREVALVGNDWGGAQLLVTQGRDDRVGRLVLVACEAFDNYPPGIPGRLAPTVGEELHDDLPHGAVDAPTPTAAGAVVLGLDE